MALIRQVRRDCYDRVDTSELTILSRLAHDLIELRMLLGGFLLFGLVPFVSAQLLAQGSMELEPEMMSGTGPGHDDYPGHTPLDVENYPVAPATLELEQVHMFVRHGAFQRSSTYSFAQSVQVNARL